MSNSTYTIPDTTIHEKTLVDTWTQYDSFKIKTKYGVIDSTQTLVDKINDYIKKRS